MMTDKQYAEKDEKQFDEKEQQKHDEKMGRRGDLLSSITWAAVLIWAGLVFLAANTGRVNLVRPERFMLRQFSNRMLMVKPGIWGLILFGTGVILVIAGIIRLLAPSYHRHVAGTLILGIVFISFGLGNFYGWRLVWPFALILMGVAVLLGGILRGKSPS